MPRDDWAPTRTRDAIRRATSGSRSYLPSTKQKKKRNKHETKQARIRREMAESKRLHDGKLGASKHSRNAYRIVAGTTVEVRKPGVEWRTHVTKLELVTNHRRTVGGFFVYRHDGWEIRIPRPIGN